MIEPTHCLINMLLSSFILLLLVTRKTSIKLKRLGAPLTVGHSGSHVSIPYRLRFSCTCLQIDKPFGKNKHAYTFETVVIIWHLLFKL
jgi:hypothetical protein